MDSFSWVLLVTAVSLVFMKLQNYRRSNKNLPPGPRPWPIIGNLNFIGSLPHQSLHTLSQTYGNLMHLRFGSTPVVVASSPDMAKQFLRTHDHIFAYRPSTAAGKYTSYNNRNIVWAPYGEYWKQGRKIYLNELFNSKTLDSFEYIRVEEMKLFLSSLHKDSGNDIVLKDYVSRLNLSVISRIVLGRKYFNESSKDDMVTLDEFGGMLDEWFLLNGVLNIGDWIPWIQFMDLQGYVKRMKGLRKRFDKFYDRVIKEHMAQMKTEGEVFVAKDMVDLLLELAQDPNLEVKLDYDSVKGLTGDLLLGGTDTASTTVEWAMSELIKQPYLMKKATEELDRVVSRERWVQETDIPNLHFIYSIIKETMRLHPVSVVLAPHQAHEDCKVTGYDIAKGTVVFINTWSIGRDPNVWDDPERFKPERFLERDVDIKGQHFELLPFGSGRRMCPGYSLGLKMMMYSLGNLLHGFNWKLPENIKIEDINMEEVYGLTIQRKFLLVVIPEPRLPNHIYN